MPSFPTVTFHLYGLLVGIALIAGGWLASLQAKKYGLIEKQYEQAVFWVVLVGFIGARLWHVLTDFQLYATNVHQIVYVWNGGLSIIGGLVGAAVGLYFYSRIAKFSSLLFTDTAIFGLPVAQAIGRLGNYVNHELYGLPTSLPWGIFIPPEFRTREFQDENYFHPLFAYELLATLSFAIVIWWIELRIRTKQSHEVKNIFKVGSGRLTVAYILYYALIRFFLDFLRIDRGRELYGLGFNQIVLLLTIVVVSVVVWRSRHKLYAK